MLVEDVVRRNRRRIALITVVALLNYWVFTALLLALPVGLRLVARVDVPVPIALGVCLALAGPRWWPTTRPMPWPSAAGLAPRPSW